MSSTRDPYRAFAGVYDQDVQVEIPRAFFRTLRPLIRAHRVGPPILDLGCGSGLLTAELARAGARVVGVDASREMLDLARERCAPLGRSVRLVHARLEHLELHRPARLALACQDVVNHLPSLSTVRRAFAAVRRALQPGGLFLFDTITAYCFRTYWTDNTHLLEGPLGDVLMSCTWDPERRRGSAHIVGYARRADGAYARHATVLHEHLYSDAELGAALRAAGFTALRARPWSPWRAQDAEARRHRRLWCAAVAPLDPEDERRLRALGFRPAR
ncbi:MAG TPA: methyltransferase domain-containing protein [Planctomycetota bacterium]